MKHPKNQKLYQNISIAAKIHMIKIHIWITVAHIQLLKKILDFLPSYFYNRWKDVFNLILEFYFFIIQFIYPFSYIIPSSDLIESIRVNVLIWSHTDIRIAAQRTCLPQKRHWRSYQPLVISPTDTQSSPLCNCTSCRRPGPSLRDDDDGRIRTTERYRGHYNAL